MAVRSLRTITPKVWIPPTYSTKYKLEVIRDGGDGSSDDITELISGAEVEDGVTDSIGRFEFSLWNPNQTYLGAWEPGDLFKYYKDYDSSATTIRFSGIIEKVSYKGNKIRVSGRSDALKFMDLTVTQSYTNTECGAILKDLVSKYGSDFTSNNVGTSSTTLTVNWYQKPFWDCVEELTTASSFDAYVDANLDFNFFESGTRVNDKEGIVHTHNLLEVGDFADDSSLIKNRVIIYGAEEDGTQLLYSSNDISSQDKYGIKEEIVSDSNITNGTQAQERGDFLVAQSKNPQQISDIKGIQLATIQPGENIRISSPADNIPPGLYRTVNYKDKISLEGGGGFTTTVSITKEPRRISNIFKSLVENQNKLKSTTVNPYEMGFSYNDLFNTDTGAHTDTEITNGVLKPTGASGNWISVAKTITGGNITEVYLVAIGETLTGASFEVSGNNGSNYETITNKGRLVLSTSVGTQLRVKVTFDNADTQIDSLMLLYKVTT